MEIFLGIGLIISVISNVVIVRLFLREMEDYKDRFMARDYRELQEFKIDISKAMKERLKEPEEKKEVGDERLKEIADKF